MYRGACRWPRAAAAARALHAQASAAAGLEGGWLLSLERGIGKAYGAEGELQATGAFGAEVFPDLPIATTWLNLAKALREGPSAAGASSPTPPFTHYTTRPGAAKVITVAANLRGMAEIERRLEQAAGEAAAAGGGQCANALLCVSGSHPVRSLPLVARLLHSSLDSLAAAQRLKARGVLPPATQLWAVANPNTERDASLLERKAELGASVVLTQPPLDWPAYLRWLDDAERRGLLRSARPPPPPGPPPLGQTGGGGDSAAAGGPSGWGAEQQAGAGGAGLQGAAGGGGGSGGGVRLLVGHPMASSTANLSFWISLSGCGRSAEARSLLAAAAAAELGGGGGGSGGAGGGGGGAAEYCEQYNRELVRKVLERGGVAGLHVMPITKAAKRMALRMLQDGALPAGGAPAGGAAPRGA